MKAHKLFFCLRRPLQVQFVLCCVHRKPGVPDPSPERHHHSHAADPQIQRRHHSTERTDGRNCGHVGRVGQFKTRMPLILPSPPFRRTSRRTRPSSCWMTTTMTTTRRTTSWRTMQSRMSTMSQGAQMSLFVCLRAFAMFFLC